MPSNTTITGDVTVTNDATIRGNTNVRDLRVVDANGAVQYTLTERLNDIESRLSALEP